MGSGLDLRGLLKKSRLLTRPTLARRDAPFPGKAAADESTGGVASGLR